MTYIYLRVALLFKTVNIILKPKIKGLDMRIPFSNIGPLLLQNWKEYDNGRLTNIHPYDDKQNYPCCTLKLLVKKFAHC